MKDLIPFGKRNFLRRRDGLEDFYDVMDNFFSSPMTTGRSFIEESFKLDIKDEEDKYIVKADLPGVERDEINLRVSDGTLIISIERESPKIFQLNKI